MKRRAKLFLLLTTLLCLVGLGTVFHKIQQNAGAPFPGAVVVLDDASWRSRTEQDLGKSGYLWTTADAIVYRQKTTGGYRAVRRRILSHSLVFPPEVLPPLLKEEPHIDSLSPDGKILCLKELANREEVLCTLLRMDRKSKPVIFTSESYRLVWSPESKFLYAMPDINDNCLVERYDAQTGAVTKTTLNTTQDPRLEQVTPEGKLLGLDGDVIEQTGSHLAEWKITEVQGKNVITTKYQKHFAFPMAWLYLSPDGKRILWRIFDEANSFWEQWQQRLFGRSIAPHPINRWQVTDRDGSNTREIGCVLDKVVTDIQPELEWTPDGKGVHFLQDGKLMYLAVP